LLKRIQHYERLLDRYGIENIASEGVDLTRSATSTSNLAKAKISAASHADREQDEYHKVLDLISDRGEDTELKTSIETSEKLYKPLQLNNGVSLLTADVGEGGVWCTHHYTAC